MKRKIVRINKIIIFLTLFIILLLRVVNAGSYNTSDFKVIFTGNPKISDSEKIEAKIIDNATATIELSGLQKAGDIGIIEFTLQNRSMELLANLSIKTINSNSEYFSVKSELGKEQLQNDEEVSLTVSVELIKTPISENVFTTIDIQLEAEPMHVTKQNNESEEKTTTVVQEVIEDLEIFIPNTGDSIIIYIIMLILLIVVLIIITIIKKSIKNS